jgi:peptidyl-prolyl cis-trans isomerase SurA
VIIFNAVSEDVANEAQAQMKAGQSWKMLVEEKQGELQGDSGRFELTQINGNASATPGSFSPAVKNADGTATFMQYFKTYGGGEQRSYEDSKGMVINDYQNIVEKRWIEELRKKYPVKVNEVLLKQIVKEAN